ncbi:MAG: preprotein translocase subunit YajC [Clostridium sp.]|nr:preprotein translocase subunit YajC [Clostridium sp.]
MPEQYQEIVSALIIPVAFVAVMYFMVILPQKRRNKQHRQMIESLRVGDNIVTTGGIVGTVVNIKDDEVTLETGIEKTKIKFVRSAVVKIQEATEGA